MPVLEPEVPARRRGTWPGADPEPCSGVTKGTPSVLLHATSPREGLRSRRFWAVAGSLLVVGLLALNLWHYIPRQFLPHSRAPKHGAVAGDGDSSRRRFALDTFNTLDTAFDTLDMPDTTDTLDPLPSITLDDDSNDVSKASSSRSSSKGSGGSGDGTSNISGGSRGGSGKSNRAGLAHTQLQLAALAAAAGRGEKYSRPQVAAVKAASSLARSQLAATSHHSTLRTLIRHPGSVAGAKATKAGAGGGHPADAAGSGGAGAAAGGGGAGEVLGGVTVGGAGGASALVRAKAALADHMVQVTRDVAAGKKLGSWQIPKIIHQVYGLFADKTVPPHVVDSMDSFRFYNKGYTHILWGPQDLDAFVELYHPSLWPIYSRMRVPALKADWVRYMLVYTFGGVYSDLDTMCLRPVNTWADGREGVSIIVGIEVDAANSTDWAKHWGRQLQICQWTFASAPGHPVLADVLYRSQRMLSARVPVTVTEDDVTQLTGPYVFTDSIYQYMAAQGYDWTNLLGKNKETQVGDLYVLSITGFSPGVGHMGAEERSSPLAKVQHLFAGGWTTHRETDKSQNLLKKQFTRKKRKHLDALSRKDQDEQLHRVHKLLGME